MCTRIKKIFHSQTSVHYCCRYDASDFCSYGFSSFQAWLISAAFLISDRSNETRTDELMITLMNVLPFIHHLTISLFLSVILPGSNATPPALNCNILDDLLVISDTLQIECVTAAHPSAWPGLFIQIVIHAEIQPPR